MIPNVVHFVFGLREQDQPFHFLHYVAIESCRRRLQPDLIYFHAKYQPWGPWWERIADAVTYVEVGLSEEVGSTDYSRSSIPSKYLYAHHADVVRLDALLTYGGIYADIDTVFLNRPPERLFSQPFVIGREAPLLSRSGVTMSLCNAFMMSEPEAIFARRWRSKIGEALDGTWSNHSGTLAHQLSEENPTSVHVETEETFFPIPADSSGLYGLLLSERRIPEESVSVHLWAHLWWERERRDLSPVHAGWYGPEALRYATTTLANLVREYIPDASTSSVTRWSSAVSSRERYDPHTQTTSQVPDKSPTLPQLRYLSYDDESGYGTAARRTISALQSQGVDLSWTPLIPSPWWGSRYAPPLSYDPFRPTGAPEEIIVAHTVPEDFTNIRRSSPRSRIIGHTVWETEEIPEFWRPHLEAVDLLVTPSQVSARALRRSGVKAPVVVVPHAAESANYALASEVASTDSDRFRFYTIADWSARKGTAATVEAYLRAFTREDPVVLLVKTSPFAHIASHGPSNGGFRQGATALLLAKIVSSFRSPAAIRLITHTFSDAQIASLHKSGDCYVSLCRAEGWGIGAFDAALAGNPVVTTGWGGHLDFLGDSPYLVNYRISEIEEQTEPSRILSKGYWAEPDIDHAASFLREIFARRKQPNHYASERASVLHSRYDTFTVGGQWRDVLRRLSIDGFNIADGRL